MDTEPVGAAIWSNLLLLTDVSKSDILALVNDGMSAATKDLKLGAPAEPLGAAKIVFCDAELTPDPPLATAVMNVPASEPLKVVVSENVLAPDIVWVVPRVANAPTPPTATTLVAVPELSPSP